MLWRSFYHESRLPITDELLVDESLQYTDCDDWAQAVSSTTHRRGDPLHDLEGRRKPNWRRFESSAIRARKSTQAEDDAWAPPDMLERITKVVRAGAPTRVKFRPPTIEKLRPMVQDIFGECQAVSTQDFEMSYEELLALMTATLQVGPGGRSTLDTPYAANVAKALLDVADINAGSAVSWEHYLAFTERFVSELEWQRYRAEDVTAIHRSLL